MNEFIRSLTPMGIFRWATVAFVIAVYVLFIVTFALAIFGVYG